LFVILLSLRSSLRDSAYRAGACAGSAVDASISIDVVLGVALRNSAYRAALSTGTTRNAGIRNLICHYIYLLNGTVIYC